MARVSKPPAERRDELLDTALRLCTTVGYDALAIDQITTEANVAKGTFYYYFRTKQDMLIALVDRFADELFENLERLAADPPPVDDGPQPSAQERFRLMLLQATAWKSQRLDDAMAFIPLLYKPENLELRHRLFATWTARMWHLFHPYVTAGKADGSFHLDDPEATTDLILSVWVDGSARMYDRALAQPTEDAFVDTFTRGIAALTDAAERILGAAPDSFHVDVEPGLVRALRAPFLAALHGPDAAGAAEPPTITPTPKNARRAR